MLTRAKSLFRRIRLPLPSLKKLFAKGDAGKGTRKLFMIACGFCLATTAVLYVMHRFPLHVYKAQNDSMAPALYRGDLFGVERVTSWFRQPRRYDLVSYRYPLDQSERRVHRVIGLANEKVRIEGGDLWVRPKGGSWRILRKPEGVQNLLWKEVTPAGISQWFADEEVLDWDIEGSRVDAPGPGFARWGEPGTSIVDAYEDGHTESRSAQMKTPPALEENIVGDLRLAGWVRAKSGCVEAWIELREGKKTYRFSIPGPAAGIEAAPGIRVGKTAQLAQPYRLPENQEVEVRATNLDDELILEVDGTQVASLEIDPVAPRSNEVRVGFTGGGGVFEDLVLERDVHYVSPPEGDFNVTVPEGHFMLLGDNPQHFMDPRFWRVLKLSVKTEEGTKTYEGDLRPTENPRTYVEDGDAWLQFQDREGRKHEFLRNQVKKRTFEPAPFVATELIEGRVFWGLND